MSTHRIIVPLLAILATLPFAAAATGQTATAPRVTPDADALADAMRRLATNPRDVDALVTAGELSLRLGDMSGAGSLFARAEKVDPMNARVKAGMGSILVQEERPGAALRYFDQAVGYGLDPRRFASDRGLAYDLIGEQERAQRDYRVALKDMPSDDLTRRYALSLGISGRRDQAFAVLDPLLRKQDRSAWRARAFILAMGGDQAGADSIATSMMPGFASGLRPFFQRLPGLPAAERAFAVHFGEIRPTPERLADARLVPALAPLSPEAGTSTMLAANTVPAPMTRLADASARRGTRNVGSREAPSVAAPAFVAPPVGAMPPPMASRPSTPALAVVEPAPVTRVPSATQSANAASRPTIASPSAISAAPVTSANAGVGVPTPYRPALPGVSATTGPGRPSVLASLVATTAPVQAVPVQAVPGRTIDRAASLGSSAPIILGVPSGGLAATVAPATAASNGLSAGTPAATPSAATLATVQPLPSVTPASPAASAFVQAVPVEAPMPARRERPIRATRVARTMNDSILAKIVAGIEVPDAELASAPVATPAPGRRTRRGVASAAAVAAEPVRVDPESKRRTKRAEISAEVAAIEPADMPSRRGRRGRRADDPVEQADAQSVTAPVAGPRSRRGEKSTRIAADAEAPADRATARRTAAKTLADRKTTEKTRAARKDADDAALAKKAERAQPSRIWVQVAGGANEGDLTKAWSATKAKAPALAGKSAYATPLRATNRVLTGPFKTDAEARAFVNTLARQGVSAFSFTSEAGQKVARLPAK